MDRRLLIGIMVLALFTLPIVLESENGNGETVNQVTFKFDEIDIEMRVNNVIIESEVPVPVPGDLINYNFKAISKKVGYEPHRTYGSATDNADDFYLQKFELRSGTINVFLEMIEYKIKFDDTFGHVSEEITCSIGDYLTIPEYVPLKNGYSVPKWISNEKEFSCSERVSIDADLINACKIVNKNIIITPKVELKKFTGFYELDGGIADYAYNTVLFDVENYVNVANVAPTKLGSVFKYWMIENTVVQLGGSYKMDPLSITDDAYIVKINAIWSASITPTLEHCFFTTEYGLADYGESWFTIIKPEEHYFLPDETAITGATYTLGSDGTARILTGCVNGPIEFSISAIPIEHTITFDSRGGSDVESLTFTEIEEKTLPTPTKAGHTFNGWFDGENKIENTTGIVDDITVIADWTYVPPTYLVRFYDRQDGNLLKEATTEGTVTAPETPSRSGYRFVQWKSTDGAFTGTVTKDTDYYAEWAYVPPTYLVRFYDIQGGNLVHETITECSVTAPDAPTRSGYRFVQWKSTDGVFTGTVNRNTDYYAEWSMIYVPSPTKPDPVVTFYLEEGGEMYVQYRQSEFKESPVPAKNGYTFDHWYHLVDLERVEFTGEFDEDIDVYASWTAKMNRFHLSEDGDTWFEGYVCSNDPVKEGHVFDGWYIIDGDERKQFTGGLDLDVYASWKEETISPPSSDRDMGLLLPVIVMSLILVMILGFVIHQKRVR